MKKILILLSLLLCLTGCSPVVSEQTQGPAYENTHTPPVSEYTPSDDTDTDSSEETTAAAPGTDAPSTQDGTLSITFAKNISKDEVLVVGRCENGCTVSVSGGITGEKSIKPDGEDFLFTVRLPKGAEDVISVKAICPGGREQSVSLNASYKRAAEDMNIFASVDSRLFRDPVLDDICRTNTFSKAELWAVKNKAEKQVQKVREQTGKQTKIIYLLAPHSLSVYPEGIGDELSGSIKSTESRYAQALAALSEVDGVEVIDSTEVLKANRDKGKLYYNLDSHWTELGAYFAYRELMNRIAADFPAAKPHGLDEYDIENVTLDYTDMIYYADAVGSGMRETAPFLHARYAPKTPYDAAKSEVADIGPFSKKFFSGKTSVTSIDDPTLPIGQLVFDSYAFNCVQYIAEHFSTLACQPAWRYAVDYEMSEQYKPDYVIYILSERSLGNLVG